MSAFLPTCRPVMFLLMIWILKPSVAFPQSGLDFGGGRTRRDDQCSEQEYQHNNMCCSNCPAGTRVISACTKPGGKGKCEECEDGMFTEHGSGLRHCFKCTRCRSDQEVVRPCSHTANTECQCRLGGFCAPDQACEVCKKCSRCRTGEVMVRNCTSTTNTECKKVTAHAGSASAKASVIVPLVLTAVVIAGVIVAVVWRRLRPEDPQRAASVRLKAEQEDEQVTKLVPVNGEESLRRCFEYFEEIDINHHKRFFRHLSIGDNVILSKEHLPYEDRIHELLNVWVEKKGRDASLSDLLTALLALNQRRTAETIKEKAVLNGHYFTEY